MATKTRGKAGLAVGFDNDDNRWVFGAMWWLKHNAHSKERVAEMIENMNGREWQITQFKSHFESFHQRWNDFRKQYPDIVVLTGNKNAQNHTNGYGSKVYGYTKDCFAVSGMTKEESRMQNRFHRLDRETQQVPMENLVGLAYEAMGKRFAHRLYIDDMPKFDYKPTDFNFDELAELAKQEEERKSLTNDVIRAGQRVANEIVSLQNAKSNADMRWFDPAHIRAFVLEKQAEVSQRVEDAQTSFDERVRQLDDELARLDDVGGVLHKDYLRNITVDEINLPDALTTLRVDYEDYEGEARLALIGLMRVFSSKMGVKHFIVNEETGEAEVVE